MAAVVAAAARLGRTVGGEEAGRLARYFELLLLWNARINLTGARSLEALLSEHLPDSIALAELVPEGRTVLDVGSGGGLPAIPLGVLRPDVRLTLVEPRTRRVAFLRTAVREIALPARIEPIRLEDVRDRHEVVSARAVFPRDEWVAAARSHVSPGGLIIVYLQDADPWQPPTDLPIAGTVRYPASTPQRRALALQVPSPSTR